jgi:hypothetical protein
MKMNDVIALTRPWSNFQAGDRFRVAKVVEATNNMKNVKAVIDDPLVKTEDEFHWRTLPAEDCVVVPQVGSSTTVEANQGTRDATVLATLGLEVLLEYEMPAGKTFLRIENLDGGRHRSVSHSALPKKWRKELEA